jgi:hypothetical protein
MEDLVTDDATDQTDDRISTPMSIEELPVLLTPAQLAAFLSRSERTLERDRGEGDGIPFVKYRNSIYYFRDEVIASLRKRVYMSTAEAKRAAKEAGQ